MWDYKKELLNKAKEISSKEKRMWDFEQRKSLSEALNFFKDKVHRDNYGDLVNSYEDILKEWDVIDARYKSYLK